jgi:hypothetical protein
VQIRREGILRLCSFEMSNLSADMMNAQLDRVDADVRPAVVRKTRKRQVTANSSAVCKHSRMKHNKPLADAPNRITSPTSTPPSDTPASNQRADNPTGNPLIPDQPQGSVAYLPKVAHPLSVKRANDAARYLSLCAASPLAFRRAIDALPTSSIIRIYELICIAAKGDGQVKLSSKQRRLCTKYGTDSRASSKTKRRLLRRATKETVRSVFAPLMLQTAFGATDGGVMSATLQAITTANASFTF